jgi:hypothetical protein
MQSGNIVTLLVVLARSWLALRHTQLLHFGSVRCGADSLHAGVFGAVVIAGGDNVTVECAADLFAVFKDGSLCAYLHAAILKDFDVINHYVFL